MSCSYGPGRYDPAYEEQGQDYPIGFVRWTEQRNFEAVLELLAAGRLAVTTLISHRFPIAEAGQGYELLGTTNPLAIVLQYPESAAVLAARDRVVKLQAASGSGVVARPGPRVSVIGSGNYASQVLVPALATTTARLRMLVSAAGVSGVQAGRKHGFAVAGTDAASAIQDADTDAIVIATRHDTHADLVVQALGQRKHVFVEKPMAITRRQLDDIVAAHDYAERTGFRPVLMVGFNRRFAPQVVQVRALLAAVAEPKVFVMTVNAGAIPPEHWTQDEAQGGGRIIGEGCHFVDLLRFLAGSPIRRTHAVCMGPAPGVAVREDKAVLTLEFEDGSFGTVHYVANGHRSFPKERLEVFCRGAVLQLDNFRRLTGYGWPGFRKMNLWRQDKGNEACVHAFVDAISTGKPSPMPFGELVEVTRATFDAVDAMHARS